MSLSSRVKNKQLVKSGGAGKNLWGSSIAVEKCDQVTLKKKSEILGVEWFPLLFPCLSNVAIISWLWDGDNFVLFFVSQNWLPNSEADFAQCGKIHIFVQKF